MTCNDCFEMLPTLDWKCKTCFEVMDKDERASHKCDDISQEEIDFYDDQFYLLQEMMNDDIEKEEG